ncbi:hypothetical protein BJ875DRAFT_519730 [Amylocarpus encephaloides]|uniref:Uncharacterized protein n=1 Tax=Amylocarpus encephaloides TaxID=45428 RepID=A0A9P7YBW0_9HELO|nr:hypothetical protein BJ875DRAFT_519730 [Amylocarpus encephaloides]
MVPGQVLDIVHRDTPYREAKKYFRLYWLFNTFTILVKALAGSQFLEEEALKVQFLLCQAQSETRCVVSKNLKAVFCFCEEFFGCSMDETNRIALLHGLLGLSLLQSLMVEAMVSSRLYLGTASYLDRRRAFPQVYLLIYIITATFCIAAFTFILRGVSAFLLGQTIVSFVTNTLWVSLITYNFEWRGAARTIEENSHGNQRGKLRVNGLWLVSDDVVVASSIIVLEM